MKELKKMVPVQNLIPGNWISQYELMDDYTNRGLKFPFNGMSHCARISSITKRRDGLDITFDNGVTYYNIHPTFPVQLVTAPMMNTFITRLACDIKNGMAKNAKEWFEINDIETTPEQFLHLLWTEIGCPSAQDALSRNPDLKEWFEEEYYHPDLIIRQIVIDYIDANIAYYL